MSDLSSNFIWNWLLLRYIHNNQYQSGSGLDKVRAQLDKNLFEESVMRLVKNVFEIIENQVDNWGQKAVSF